MKKEKEKKPRTVKSIIIQIIISLIVFIGVFYVLIWDQATHSTARFYSRIWYYFLFLGLSFISIIEGLVFLPSSIKNSKVKKEESKNIEENEEDESN